MAKPAVQIPTITVGTHLTDFAALDLTVEGFAAGGMGLVVWGRNAAQDYRVEALKMLKPERLSAAAAHSPMQRRAIERQFEDEALVWCHLWPHPYVVSTYGLTRLSALGDVPVLRLDYAPNGSLRDQLRHARQQHTYPPLRTSLAWAVHIASALAHIHQPDPAHDRPNPLVYCDLKPENVVLSAHAWAQLTDLGLTRAYVALAAESSESSQPRKSTAPTGPSSASNLPPHKTEVARLRAVLQEAGALPPDQLPAMSAAVPAAEELFFTRTLLIPPVIAAPPPVSASLPLHEPPERTRAPYTAPAEGSAIGSRGPVAGSPPYMAPEQWLGMDAVVPATDVYAFGVLLYEVFAGSDAPHPFPHDPTRFLTPQLYAQAQAFAYDPALLAWHAAHTASSGPAHRLTDPDVAEAALRSGPLAELANRGDGAGRAAAEHALKRLDVLITACLAPKPAARPTAGSLQPQLAALIVHPCGLEPLPAPPLSPVTPQRDGAFWTILGMTYGMLGRQEEAVALQRRAIERDPMNPSSWINLASSLNSLGEQEAREAAEAAVAGHGEEAAALGVAARRHWEESLAAYQQAETHLSPKTIAEYPTLPATIATNLGSTLSNLGRYAEAVASCQRAIAFQPDNHVARYNLALHYARWSKEFGVAPAERLERLRAAQSEIRSVLAVEPNFAGAHSLAERIAHALAEPEHRFRG